MRKFVLCAALMTVLVAGASKEAHAGNLWSMQARGCSVDQDSINNQIWRKFVGSVKFASLATGVIYLDCPVSDTSITFIKYLFVTFDDTDGTADHFVEATLYRVSKSSGFATNLGTIGSDSYTAKTSPYTGQSVALDHTTDFTNYFYTVEITLVRDTTSYDPSVVGVRLTSS